jgi:hypothetical protein
MGEHFKRHARGWAITFGAVALTAIGVAVWQAVLLHTQGWRLVTKSLPEWIGAFASFATAGAFLIAFLVYLNNRRQQHRQQAELITVWRVNEGESGSSADNPIGWTGIRLGFINASQGLAHVQVQLTGELSGDQSQETRDEVKDKLVRRLFVPFLEPGNWEALAALADMRLSLLTVEVAFRDQALRWWVRDLDTGTLEPAEQGLFPVSNNPGLVGDQRIDRLDVQARRRPQKAGIGNAGVVASEVVRRLWAIEPVEYWPQDGTQRPESPLMPEQALEVAHIRALQQIGDSIRELNNYDA